LYLKNNIFEQGTKENICDKRTNIQKKENTSQYAIIIVNGLKFIKGNFLKVHIEKPALKVRNFFYKGTDWRRQ
jgi:hypothetical protein